VPQGTGRVGQGPQDVPYQHGVEALLPDRRCRRVTDEEHGVTAGRFLPGEPHHGRGEIHARHPVPLLGREE
jgi:hypothetical protein